LWRVSWRRAVLRGGGGHGAKGGVLRHERRTSCAHSPRALGAVNASEQGVTGITIVNPKGESYDIDRFGMIVSTNEEGEDATSLGRADGRQGRKCSGESVVEKPRA
jgi:hypothetical protein